MNVSVVIPVKDMVDDLSYAVKSALSAGSDDVIVIDDHSDDWSSDPPFENYYHLHVNTGYMRHVHEQGVCCARNLGIFYANNDLIVPLDADDELLSEGLAKLIAAWEPGTLVYGNWIETGSRGPGGEGFDTLKIAPPPEMLHRKNVAHATWLFHKDDWRRVSGYDPDFNIGGEDWAFMCALVQAGVRPVRVDATIYRRTVHAGSRTDQARSRTHFIQQLMREKYPDVMHG